MSLIEIIALAGALAVDAFSVGAAVGIIHNTRREILRLSFHFGLFQSLMTVIGYLAGSLLIVYISDYDHWIIFSILAFLGFRFIATGLKHKDDVKPENSVNLTKGITMIALSLSVSIDALGAGIGLRVIDVNVRLAVALIGIVSLIATAIAMNLARKISPRSRSMAIIIAGIVLSILGLKILIEHLCGFC
ncbi:MAG: manganese efflux pump [Acidobacteria bacterium]|nr:manganese efflux pump [Acidobacteriota bacterium]